MGSVSYGVNLFYIKGDNMIQTVARKNVNTGEVENYGLELEAAWRIDDHWTVNTNHSFLHMNYPVLAAPEYKGWIGGRFRQGKWSADAGLQIVSGLFTQVETERRKENFCLFNASINYQLCKPASLWLRGENLLAQRYEIIAGYPMPRATFMGGASIRF